MKRALAFTLMVLAIMIIAVSCEEPQAPHEHEFSKDWTSDAEYHWHKATCEHTDEVSGKEDHVFGDWIIDEDSTEGKTGTKHRICSVCKYEEKGTVPLQGHVHTFSAYDYNGSKHWRTCTGCGEKFSYTHSLTYVYDSDTHYQTCYCGYETSKVSHSLKDNTDKATGKAVQYCECGYSITKSITAEKAEPVATQIVDGEVSEEGTIIDASGEFTGKTTTSTKDVSIEVAATVAAATTDSTNSSSTTTPAPSQVTKVTFPAGALKVITSKKENGEESKIENPTVTLKITAVPAVEATSVESDYQGTKTKTGEEDDTAVVKTDEAVVAAFKFELTGATSSGLTGTDGSKTEVVTYIAKGICATIDEQNPNSDGRLKIAYIGTAETGKEPEIVSYDSVSGELVFKVCHFSKYAIIATNIVATDNHGNMYASLAEAVGSGNVKDGDTVTLLKDISELNATVNVNKSIVLDLNGKKITTKTSALNITKGTLTLRNGSIESNEELPSGYVVSVNCTSGNAGLVLEDSAAIKGTACSGIISKGTSSYTATLKISGNVESNGTAIYQESYGYLAIDGKNGDDDGIKSTAGSAVEIGGGTAVINGGKLIAEAEYNAPTTTSPSVVGAAVAVAQTRNDEPITVAINGGTFTVEASGKQLAIVNPKNYGVNSKKLVKVTLGSTVAMNSTKIVGTKASDSKEIAGNYYVDAEAAVAAEGAAARVGEDKYYESLQAAMDDADAGATITLLKDVERSGTEGLLYFDASEATLDLNSKTIKRSLSLGRKNYGQTDLKSITIKNGTVDDREMRKTDVKDKGMAAVELWYPFATIESGTFISNGIVLNIQVNTIFDAEGKNITKKCTKGADCKVSLKILGGKFVAEGNGKQCVAQELGKTIIEGGTFIAKDVVFSLDSPLQNMVSKLIINNGEFESKESCIIYFYERQNNGADMEIHGGIFKYPSDYEIAYSGDGEVPEGALKIYGGTFSSDPSAYVVEGYKAVKDETKNTWTVFAESEL